MLTLERRKKRRKRKEGKKRTSKNARDNGWSVRNEGRKAVRL
jgi:hypothetical protein